MIDPRFHRCRRSMLLVRKRLVRRNQQSQCAAVRADQPIVAPLLDHHVLQHRIHRHRRSIPCVIRRHHRARSAFFKSHAKWHRIVLAKQPLIEIGRSMCASVFVLICHEMFHQRGGLPVLRIRPLQSVHERDRQRSHQVRVFAHRFFCPSPSRIAAQIRIRRTHHHASAVPIRILIEIARLISLERADLFSRSGSHVAPNPFSCGNVVVGAGCLPRAAPVRRSAQRLAVKPFDLT